MEKWPATNKYYQMIQIFIRLCHICVILSIVLSICLILLRVGKEKKKKNILLVVNVIKVLNFHWILSCLIRNKCTI